ncbi:pimeloyl-ACP methyl ester carboxylesterase [Sphingomonas faeni]|nr:pimeloyl-ACP methyl ester carboxylesterase [Sphingomonas faeni]
MRFPHCDYDDMVEVQYRLLHDWLGIRRMRLIMGTSMGCMHSLVWGETHPEFVRALMPLACEPVEITGLNRMWRKLAIDGIKADPAWADGEYARYRSTACARPPACCSSPERRRFTSRNNIPAAMPQRHLPSRRSRRRSRGRMPTT